MTFEERGKGAGGPTSLERDGVEDGKESEEREEMWIA
jgi:hypothetical protein